MKGHRAQLLFTLQEDVIFSATNITTGSHESRRHVPGSALLGAAAARLYQTLAAEQAFTLFHSGAMRFGNGHPLTHRGHPAYPMPLCWHEIKGKKKAIRETADAGWGEKPLQLDPGALHNLSIPAPASNRSAQFDQLRQGFVAMTGDVVNPAATFSMKTAIDPTTGRAKEGQLFGYEALQAGQRFLATLTADAEVDGGLFERVVQSLTGPLRLGRSRSAQYGGVLGERGDEGKGGAEPMVPDELRGARCVTLWALSDMAVIDPAGMPTLHPQPEWLGLPKGRLDPARSFIRTHLYTPYNATRRLPELERPVIAQGSILHFDLDEALEETHLERFQRGLGLYRESGLGQVWADCPLLREEQPTFQSPDPSALSSRSPAHGASPPVPEDSPLAQWLIQRVTGQQQRGKDARRAEGLRDTLRQLYQNARRHGGVAENVPVGPGPSQWGRVMTEAKRAPDDARLRSTLFGHSKEDAGLCTEKAGGQGWGDESILADRPLSFRAWFQQQCDSSEINGLRCFVTEFSRHAMDVAKKEHRP